MDGFFLSHSTFEKDNISGHILLVKTNEVIGTYEFNVYEDSFLACINIFPDFQKNGIGYYIFKYCFDELCKSNRLKRFIASWNVHEEYGHLENGQSTNLTIFSELVKNGMQERNALWQTSTGKWLNKIGFNSARIISRDNDNIKVEFESLQNNC